MRVEAGGDEDQVRREIVERRQDARLRRPRGKCRCRHRGASGALTMLPAPVSSLRAGAGIERHLVGRAVEHARIVPEDVLRAVAVVHVPVDDGDALGAMRLLRMAGGDGDVVEQAEAHGRRFSAWWPGGRDATKTLSARPENTSSTAALAAPIAVSAACQLFGLTDGVGIDALDAGLGDRGAHLVDEGLRVGIDNRGRVAFGGEHAVERGELLVVQHALDGPQAVGPLRMAWRRDVLQIDRMRIEPGCHDPI